MLRKLFNKLFKRKEEKIDENKYMVHCFVKSRFECRHCQLPGLDCLRNCPDCTTLNTGLSQRVHSVDAKNGFIYMAHVLCKTCTLFHLIYSLNGDLIFGMKIFNDRKLFADAQPNEKLSLLSASSTPPSDDDFLINQKVEFLHPRNRKIREIVIRHVCTACRIKHPHGMCKKCDEQSLKLGNRRLKLINGHLHIIDAYCFVHNIRFSDYAQYYYVHENFRVFKLYSEKYLHLRY